MGILKWYRRDPRAFLIATYRLSLEERGAYDTLLDLIYINDGKIDDDPKLIATWLNCSRRRWLYLRERLIANHKIYAMQGVLRNERADREIHIAAVRRQRYAGKVFPFPRK